MNLSIIDNQKMTDERIIEEIVLNKQPILDYLKDKNGEEKVILLLKQLKKEFVNPKNMLLTLNSEHFSLILELIRKSDGRLKYAAIILISNIKFGVNAKFFCEMCKVVVENIDDNNKNIQQACFILLKNLDSLLKVLPLINAFKKVSDEEVNLFYESFRTLFCTLYSLYFTKQDLVIKKSILKSLEVILPKIFDMAKFWKDNEELGMVNKIWDEIKKRSVG